jgi:phosphoglycolate phosphatase
MRFSLVVFDLDGTLIDSAPDLRRALNAMLAEYGAGELSLPEVKGMVGEGAAQLVSRALAARAVKVPDPQAALRRFLQIYAADPIAETQLYDGVVSALQTLSERGLRLAVCTNKPISPTQEILRRLDLGRHFMHVRGGDSQPFRKPDARMLSEIMSEAAVEPERCLMVGDSEIDAATAQAAGVAFALMTYGYRRGPARAMRCIAALERFEQLLPLIEG